MMRNNDIENRTGLVHGNRRGRVISTADPMEAGRVKVRVFAVYDDFHDDDIPWAIYADPFMGGSENKGGLFTPDEGDLVWVFFEEGDPTQPVYFAGAPARPHMPSNKSKSYPNTKVYKTRTGHYLEFTDGGHVEVYHSSGNKIELADDAITTTSSSGSKVIMDDDGNILAKAVGNISDFAERNATYSNSAGNSIVLSDAGVTITSASGGSIILGGGTASMTDAAGNTIALGGPSGITLKEASGATFSLSMNQIRANSSNWNK